MAYDHLVHYILEGKGLKRVDLMVWAAWLEKADRVICKDYVQSERYGIICISTVFLGLQHPPNGELFETMVFREKGTDKWGMPPPDDLVCAGFWGEMRRYMTYEESETGHREIMDAISELARI